MPRKMTTVMPFIQPLALEFSACVLCKRQSLNDFAITAQLLSTVVLCSVYATA